MTMTRWLFENPWPIAGLLAAVAAALYFWARQRDDKRGLIAAGLVVLLIPLPFVTDALVVAPAEELDAELDRLTAAALQRNADFLIAACSRDFRSGEYDYPRFTEAIRHELGRFTPRAIRLNGRRYQIDGRKGVADFVAIFSGQYQQMPVENYPMRLEVTFVKEPSGWKIAGVRRFDLVGGKAKEINLQAR